MNKLSCNVANCASNRDNMCCRESITVKADDDAPTYCGAFLQEIVGVTNQSVGCNPNPESHILCDACECDYNSNHECTASCVSICGNCAADKCETCCETFTIE